MAIEGMGMAAPAETAGKTKGPAPEGERKGPFRRRARSGRADGDGEKRAKRRKKRGEADAETTAQEIMPFSSVQGSFIRKKDGSKTILVHMEGMNDSLYTYDQKLRESEGLAAALVAVSRPASILKLPRAIDANASLVFIDAQIAALEHEVLTGNVTDRTDPRHVRLRLLRDHVRPEAEHEALAGDKFEHPTYIVFDFDADTPDETAMREAQIFADRVIDHGRSAHICRNDEVIEAIMLYFTPSRVDVSRRDGRSPVMAITRRGAAR